MEIEIIEKEFKEFKRKLEENMNTDKSNNFLIAHDYEDEFSHNEIRDMQNDFVELVREYLVENYNGKYIIMVDWCVHVVTTEFAKDKKLRGIYC